MTTERFPVIAALDAIDAWSQAPEPRQRELLDAAVRGVLVATHARGAYLEVEAPPLAPFALGHGTLAERPTTTTDPIRSWELTASGGRAPLGRLWLDAPAEEVAGVVRVLELAVDSAWSRAEVGHTAARLAALDSATRAIAGELDLDRVLQLIVDSVRELVSARYAALGIVDATGRIERFITSGVSAEDRAAIGAPPRGHGVLGIIIREGRSFRIPDVAKHPGAHGVPPGHPVMHAFLGVPIRIGGRTIGDFYLSERDGGAEFSEADQRLVEMFALHAAIAIQNARLHTRVQRLAVVDERIRIGRDLHDGIIQGIYAVALSLEDVAELIAAGDDAEAAARVDRAIDRLNSAITEIRTFIVGLGSGTAPTSLAMSLTGVVEDIRLDPDMNLELDLDEARSLAADLTPEAAAQLQQIVREALSNVARHSGATRASVALRRDGDAAVLEIADDGRGFDPAAPRGAGHFGLANLHDRAASVGGTLRVVSAPGRGTRIIVRLPLALPEASAS